ALEAASEILTRYTPGEVEHEDKGGGDPVTEADHAVDAALKELLPTGDDGWLSEETADDPIRLERRRVWVVDPLDGTREFVQGIPEWCCSVGLVEDGQAVAGGICNPATGETIVGAVGVGVTYNGEAAAVSTRSSLNGAVVLGSRSEVKRGEWDRFEDAPFTMTPMGSVAYKLGLVAAGRADITWTLVPKHEWDIAAGVALVHAGGGKTYTLDGKTPVFNRPKPKVSGLVAVPPSLERAVQDQIAFALTV
ncbi:MAG: 3'(2'),5'-bisphosphate nucleotidase CysQ, partial [Acidobacteriota bacterium]|nr:3'(2'),5'-bisphosphate nucleotidase CysQ [Acidobacteriota bacterium]